MEYGNDASLKTLNFMRQTDYLISLGLLERAADLARQAEGESLQALQHRLAPPGEIQQAQCSGFPGLTVKYGDANGFSWPYSDEVTAGVERQVMKDMRIGVMYYYRTNRNQIGLRNIAAPPSAYTPFTVTVPNGPGGTLANPTVTRRR